MGVGSGVHCVHGYWRGYTHIVTRSHRVHGYCPECWLVVHCVGGYWLGARELSRVLAWGTEIGAGVQCVQGDWLSARLISQELAGARVWARMWASLFTACTRTGWVHDYCHGLSPRAWVLSRVLAEGTGTGTVDHRMHGCFGLGRGYCHRCLLEARLLSSMFTACTGTGWVHGYCHKCCMERGTGVHCVHGDWHGCTVPGTGVYCVHGYFPVFYLRRN